MHRTKHELLARKSELITRLEAIRRDLAGGLVTDAEEQAVQLENLAVLQEIYRLADVELQAVQTELAERAGEP
jgi:hypothetical protein